MNSCNFIGNIGRNGELRFLQNGTAVLQWSIAATSGYGDKELTTWINCSLFGKRAEAIETFVRKGQRIGVSGEISLRPYQKDGVDKTSLELRVNEVTLLVNKDVQEQKESQPKRDNLQNKRQSGGFDDIPDDKPWDDDIGF